MLVGIFELGLIYSLAVLAAYLTSRVIRFDDLGLEGSFGVGGATCAALVGQGSLSCYAAVLCAMAAGAALGGLAALLHVRMRLNNLIVGVILTTGVYSLNLRFAGSLRAVGAPNVFGAGTLGVLSLVVGLVLGFTVWLLNSEVGYLVRAVGSNPQILVSLGKRVGAYKALCLAIAHGIMALSGALFVQYLGYFSISASVGTLVLAIAGLMIGEVLVKQWWVGFLVGAVVYQAIFAATVAAGMPPVYNKLAIAALIVGVIGLRQLVNRGPREQTC